MGDSLGDTKIGGTEKPVLSRFFVCNAFLLRISWGFDSLRERLQEEFCGLLLFY